MSVRCYPIQEAHLLEALAKAAIKYINARSLGLVNEPDHIYIDQLYPAVSELVEYRNERE